MILLPDNLFSPTFRQQKLGFLFAAIMAIMVYLATLAMALQVGISTTTLSWDKSQKGRLTVEIPAPPEGAGNSQETRIQQSIVLLKQSTEVSEVRLLPDEEITDLLAPWFKDENLLKTVPLPNLLDIKLKNGAKLDADALKKRLIPVVPDVRVDGHADWMSQLHKIVKALTGLGWVLIGLTGIALVIAISLICRTALAVERRTIELLHIMGATDDVIADTFARHTQKLSWPAAVAGFALAILTVGGLAFLFSAFLVSEPRGGWAFPVSILLLVPCLAILGAVATARVAVISLLRREP